MFVTPSLRNLRVFFVQFLVQFLAVYSVNVDLEPTTWTITISFYGRNIFEPFFSESVPHKNSNWRVVWDSNPLRRCEKPAAEAFSVTTRTW